jgi:cell division septation protein DedD
VGEELVAPAPQPATQTYWRWIGLRRAKPQAHHGKPRPAKGQKQGNKKPHHAPKAAPALEAEATPSALALQLAALKEKMGG